MDPNVQRSLEAQREQQRVIQEQLARQQETVRQQNEIREAQQRQNELLRQHQELGGRRAESGVPRGGPTTPSTMRSMGSRPEIGPPEGGLGGSILRLAVIVIVVALLLFGPLHLWASFCTNVKTPIC